MLQPILIDGAWRQAEATGTFTAFNPATGAPLPEQYPISGLADIEQALLAAQQAVKKMRFVPVEAIAHFLETFAGAIEARSEALVEMAAQETGLPGVPRLRNVELPRTTDQLRQAAAAVRERSWCQATLDTTHNIRAKYSPLNGPVVVLGPSNFPFAFNSIAGGDFAAALAVGNPVIAKAHPGHPATTRLLAEAAFEALQRSSLPAGMVQMLYHMSQQDGLTLVSHPLVGATAFVGSRAAGLRLKQAAEEAGKPIYVEMSSINPVVILPNALEERLPQIVNEFCTSALSATGQFCTNPGLVIMVAGPLSEQFLERAASAFQATPPGFLFHEDSPRRLATAVTSLQQCNARVITGGQQLEGPGYRFENTLLSVSGDHFLQQSSKLQEEAFGNVSLIVLASNQAQLLEIIERLEGNLTGTIYDHSAGLDDPLYEELEPLLQAKVGRLLNNKMPTGVAVSPAMMHGGPFPASGHLGFTGVGIPASLLRFAARRCYENIPTRHLPAELREKNPTGQTWRLIDGEWTQRDL